MNRLRTSPQARVASFSLAAFAGGLVYGFVALPGTYDAAPFRTLIAVMPVEAWAAAWAVVCAVMLVCGITRSGALWLTGAVLAILLASLWLVGLLYQWLKNSTPLSPSGVALWSWFVFTLLMFLRSPHQFDKAA